MSAGFENAGIARKVVDNAKASEAAQDGLKEGIESDAASTPMSKMIEAQERYGAERNKRLRDEGNNQYVQLQHADKLSHLNNDPWIELDRQDYDACSPPLKDGSSCQILVVGAGFGGVLAAYRLLEAGFKVDDICLVDAAGGFGGTWYWNRYPGLMCDVESYLYLPLLEEMGYIPKHKYTYGSEIRQYINSIADKHGLRPRTVFQTEVKGMIWNDEKKHWQATFQTGSQTWNASSRFAFWASGLLNVPKIPNEVDIDKFQGKLFHTSRWDYEVTGGSQADPQMTNLKDKTVAVMGTGATAIQVVPELAKYAKHLYVIQRTPSAVSPRNQCPTDPERFAKEVANKPSWQKARNANFNARLSNWPDVPKEDLVNDAWTSMPSYKTVIGGPNSVSMETVGDYIKSIHAIDYERQEEIRKRVDDVVKDKDTAEKLKPWYPGFCKRPCFHDEYLETFNRDNVTLLDTDGKGIDQVTSKGVVVDGKEFPVDVLVLSTGYLIGLDTALTGLPITGRDGLKITDKFNNGWSSLHGALSRGFPNLLWFVPFQGTASANFSAVIDQVAKHNAYILAAATERARQNGDPMTFTIESTKEAEEEWKSRCAQNSLSLAAMSGCTPSYQNSEGASDKMTPEQRAAFTGLAPWGHGFESFMQLTETWRKNGDLQGVEVVRC